MASLVSSRVWLDSFVYIAAGLRNFLCHCGALRSSLSGRVRALKGFTSRLAIELYQTYSQLRHFVPFWFQQWLVLLMEDFIQVLLKGIVVLANPDYALFREKREYC